MTSRLLTALALSAALVTAPSLARAADEPPADVIERGAQMVLDGLTAFFASIPQYHAPEFLPNGDIIIRRVNPKTPEEPEKKNGDEEKGLKL